MLSCDAVLHGDHMYHSLSTLCEARARHAIGLKFACVWYAIVHCTNGIASIDVHLVITRGPSILKATSKQLWILTNLLMMMSWDIITRQRCRLVIGGDHNSVIHPSLVAFTDNLDGLGTSMTCVHMVESLLTSAVWCDASSLVQG